MLRSSGRHARVVLAALLLGQAAMPFPLSAEDEQCAQGEGLGACFERLADFRVQVEDPEPAAAATERRNQAILETLDGLNTGSLQGNAGSTILDFLPLLTLTMPDSVDGLEFNGVEDETSERVAVEYNAPPLRRPVGRRWRHLPEAGGVPRTGPQGWLRGTGRPSGNRPGFRSRRAEQRTRQYGRLRAGTQLQLRGRDRGHPVRSVVRSVPCRDRSFPGQRVRCRLPADQQSELGNTRQLVAGKVPVRGRRGDRPLPCR